MKQIVFALGLMLTLASPAFATWSVIAIDAKTGQVIIASATCVRQQGFPERKPNGARDLMDVQAALDIRDARAPLRQQDCTRRLHRDREQR